MTTYAFGGYFGINITYGMYGRGEITDPGYITTDGTLGLLQPQDILSWSLSTKASNNNGLLHSETWGSDTGGTLSFTPSSLIATETSLIFDTHSSGAIGFYQPTVDPIRDNVSFGLSSTGDSLPYYPKYVRESIDGYGYYLGYCNQAGCVAPEQVAFGYRYPTPVPAPLLAAPGLFTILLFTVLALRAVWARKK